MLLACPDASTRAVTVWSRHLAHVPALTVPPGTPVLLGYRLGRAQDLVVLPALLCNKLGTQQLPACNGKHTLLAFSVARCFFTFLVPQVFCGCELTYSDTRNSDFRGSLWTSGEAGLLWGVGGGTSSLSPLLRSQCLASLRWEGA